MPQYKEFTMWQAFEIDIAIVEYALSTKAWGLKGVVSLLFWLTHCNTKVYQDLDGRY